MCKLFLDNESVIKDYCEKNGLNFEKAKHSPKTFGQDDIYIQHYDEEIATQELAGLIRPSPMPITLKIFKRGTRLEFEQTEHTATHLAV